ncbi:MAG: cupin domain-containing protein [bacterium]
MISAGEWIEKLDLTPHPEGGYFKEVYRSNEIINIQGLPQRYGGERNFGTSIYFMLKSGQKSYLHKLQSDETWHFYYGCSIKIYIITPDGKLRKIMLGNNIFNREVLQFTIPKNSWFGAKPKESDSYSLIGCSVYPGFDFADFELGDRSELLKLYPQHENIIKKLTNE